MVRIMDLGTWELSNTEIFKVSPELSAQYKRTQLEAGDIILAIMATIGRAAVVPQHLVGANVNRALAVIKLSSLVDPNYVLAVIRSPYFQSVFLANKLGSAQARINLGDLRNFALPLPPRSEQTIILQKISSSFKGIAFLEKLYKDVSGDVNVIDNSILAKAFRGDLVPQDPNDEPASVLLDRIRAEREKLKPAKKKKKTTSKKTTKAKPKQTELKLDK